MLNDNNSDIITIGGGMVGMSLAWQLQKASDCSLQLSRKRKQLGCMVLAKSGILYAGIYYEPGSIKAELCVNGAQIEDGAKINQ